MTDSAAGSKYYELEQTVDGGSSWALINEDPFQGKVGQAERIVFFTKDYGYIGISNVSGTYSHIFVTYDGGANFSNVKLPMDLVENLPENAKKYEYTINDYDYYELPAINNGVLEINVITEASETNGITFISDDNGKNWRPE